MRIEKGAVLNDRYELRGVVGSGGMADVHRALDRTLHREVAVKVLRAATPEPGDKERFVREARILARLDHPGLTTVLDAGVAQERPFLVMHLVDGKTLSEELPERGLAPRRVAQIGAQLAATLAHAHAAGVVHRDVKPSNVLIDSDGRPRLTDFGIARLLDDATRHTATGMTVGTAAYLSPEQLKGASSTTATDVYSLGLVLVEALTGSQVYGGSITETGPSRLTTAPPIPRDLPDQWRTLLGAMTAVRAAERPSADEVRQRLDELGGGTAAEPTESHERTTVMAATTPPSSDTPGTMTLAAVRSRRRLSSVPTPYLLLTLACVAVVAIGALIVMTGGPEAPERADVPASVPDDLKPALRDLHDAVEGDSP